MSEEGSPAAGRRALAGSTERCGGCGRTVAGGTAGCRAEFDAVVGRDFSNVAYFAVHRLLVDTYSLQHPDQFCRSVKSFAAHLCGLCDLVERGASRAVGSEAVRRWLDGPLDPGRGLVKPPFPAFRGALSIADVAGAELPSEHARRVEAWARATWAAYEPLHALARRWLDEAFAATRVNAPARRSPPARA